MPKEGESPSVGWRAVYYEMGVSTVTDSERRGVDDVSRIPTSDVRVLPDDEKRRL